MGIRGGRFVLHKSLNSFCRSFQQCDKGRVAKPHLSVPFFKTNVKEASYRLGSARVNPGR